MKKIFLLFATLFLLASASAIQITPEYPTNIIVRDFDNSIPLTLKITDAEPGTYNLYTLADITIEPSEPFEIKDNEFQKTFTIKPNDNLELNIHTKPKRRRKIRTKNTSKIVRPRRHPRNKLRINRP